MLRCKKHPKYKGLRKPKVDCAECKNLYWLKRWHEGEPVDVVDQKAVGIGIISKEL